MSLSQKSAKIIAECIAQNQIFKQLYLEKDFQTIHHSHYDWWAFPIDENSSYGDEYRIG
jgi:hypothetical protein